jgi:hypothetical protein
MAAAVALGWTRLGLKLGLVLARRFRWRLSSARTAFLGTLVLTAIINGLEFVYPNPASRLGHRPFIGGIAAILTAVLGLGAVLLTRIGLQRFVPVEDEAAPQHSLSL